MPNDFKRRDPTSLFSALSALDGQVIGRLQQPHCRTAWLKSLRKLVRKAPNDSPCSVPPS
jgi:hypothetical protein